MKLLKEAGDFPNRHIVEYSTISVSIPNKFLPVNLKSYDFGSEDNTLIFLGVSSTGRLSNKFLYLNSVELAEKFVEHLKLKFRNRSYKNSFVFKVSVLTVSSPKLVTRYKIRDSEKVLSLLNL